MSRLAYITIAHLTGIWWIDQAINRRREPWHTCQHGEPL